MGKLFIAIAHDSSMGAQAQRGFLLASGAADMGHQVKVFLAGGAVGLLTETELAADAFGVPLRSYVENVLDRYGEIYLSEGAMASRSRGLESIGVRPVTLAHHTKIIELAFECDRALTFG
jgi:predicted peroxiredoxin